MKKRFLLLFLLVLLLPNFVYASDLVRNYSNNYGVSKKWDMKNQNRINHALKTPYVDSSIKIYDYSNILSEDDVSYLKDKINTFIEYTGFDMVFVSVDLPYIVDSDNEDYAADFYDYNDFGINDKYYSGILLLRNTYEDDPYFNIYAFGTAQLYYNYDRMEKVLDDIYPYFKNGVDYRGGIDKYIQELTSYFKKGKPISSRYDKLDEYGNVVEGFAPPYIVAFIIASITSLVVIFVEASKNKMVRKSHEARDYLDKNSINYDKKSDTYIRSSTSSYKISSSSSGSGTSSGGHSSGSSGGGHSSGGGRHG